MIVQFPTPYPGELLYSVLARYHIRAGNVFWKHTTEDLFGKRTVSATAFLPSGITSLVERLPENTTINQETLIEKHTMYPFYTAFLAEEKAKSIYDAMLSDDGKKIYMQSGVMASSIPQNKYFKFCSACFKETLHTYGELYWQRLHQNPGQLICTKHGLWLEDSTVKINQPNKHVFTLPTPNNCDLTKKKSVDKTLLSLYVNIITQADWLLTNRINNKDFSHFTEFYRKHLIKQGFATIQGRVYQEKLHEAFQNFFPDRFLKSLCVEIEPIPTSKSWLASITRKHRKSFHPFYHLLLLKFLDLDVEEVFEEALLSFEPFGKPKYPCLDVVCPHYKSDVIKEVTIRTCEKTKLPIGRFTCPKCGFCYTRKGIEQERNERYRYSRIMEFGPLWKKELQLLLEQQLSYREVARRLNVDANTVIKYEKINNKPKQEQESKQDKDKLIDCNRENWLSLQHKHSILSKTELRKLSPSTYAFLYRNDREWLHNNSPQLRNRMNKNKRVNWQERDQEILEVVQMAFKHLKSEKENLKRVTLKSIADAIGERALLERHLDKMPKTRAFIKEVSESEQKFRLRRVSLVIEEMIEEEEVIKVWKVLRRAGVKKEFSNELEQVILKKFPIENGMI